MSGWATHTPGEPWGDTRAGLARLAGSPSRAVEPAAEVVDAVPVGVHALGPQLHLGGTSRVLAPKVGPVRLGGIGVKPLGGFWTSTWLGRGIGSGWVRWCVDESFGEAGGNPPRTERPWLLTPRRDARVFVIDGLADLLDLLDRHRSSAPDYGLGPYVDFVSAAEEYDAIHLTDAGQWATRMTQPGLYGWDCESTVWLRWCFADVVQLPPQSWAVDEGED